MNVMLDLICMDSVELRSKQKLQNKQDVFLEYHAPGDNKVRKIYFYTCLVEI